ncbi:MAG: hypothetical protein JWO43_182 [Candidatus Adlerbacteria bacterium]|nr:hypothetical protein [Candidatus Adlerbacteria bacterium]
MNPMITQLPGPESFPPGPSSWSRFRNRFPRLPKDWHQKQRYTLPLVLSIAFFAVAGMAVYFKGLPAIGANASNAPDHTAAINSTATDILAKLVKNVDQQNENIVTITKRLDEGAGAYNVLADKVKGNSETLAKMGDQQVAVDKRLSSIDERLTKIEGGVNVALPPAPKTVAEPLKPNPAQEQMVRTAKTLCDTNKADGWFWEGSSCIRIVEPNESKPGV